MLLRFLVAGVLSSSMLLCVSANAAQEHKGRITSVTLYRGQALVTRTISLDGEKGGRTVIVGDLPEQVAPESIFAEGGEQVEVRAVRFRTRAVGQEPRDEIRKLDDAIEELQQNIELNNKNQQLLTKRSKYLDDLEGFVAPTAKTELSKGVLDAAALEKITTFSFEQRQTIVTEQVRLTQEAKALNKRLSLLQKQRAELTAGAANLVRQAVLFIEKRAEGAQQLRLNYLVNRCGWSPSYTLRAGDRVSQGTICWPV